MDIKIRTGGPPIWRNRGARADRPRSACSSCLGADRSPRHLLWSGDRRQTTAIIPSRRRGGRDWFHEPV